MPISLLSMIIIICTSVTIMFVIVIAYCYYRYCCHYYYSLSSVLSYTSCLMNSYYHSLLLLLLLLFQAYYPHYHHCGYYCLLLAKSPKQKRQKGRDFIRGFHSHCAKSILLWHSQTLSNIYYDYYLVTMKYYFTTFTMITIWLPWNITLLRLLWLLFGYHEILLYYIYYDYYLVTMKYCFTIHLLWLLYSITIKLLVTKDGYNIDAIINKYNKFTLLYSHS